MTGLATARRSIPAPAIMLASALLAGALGAQDIQVAVLSDTIRVGDVVPIAVRITLEPDQRVVWPDTLLLARTGVEMENAARLRERADTLPDGRTRVIGLYAVTPWRPGEAPLPDLALTLVDGTGEARRRTAALPVLHVVSVLPADTAGLEPRPLRGVIGPSWGWLPFLLLGLLALALAALAAWWVRRRRGAGVVGMALVPPVPPRERALALLAQARDSGLLERGELKSFYSLITEAVRDYAAALDPAWSEDLTTSELLARFRAMPGPSDARELADVLRPADRVKFARRRPDPETALVEWAAARAWVAGFDWRPAVAAPQGEVAA